MSDHHDDHERRQKRQKTGDHSMSTTPDAYPDATWSNPDLGDSQPVADKDASESTPKILKPRAYQEEMLRESLKQNVIIAVSSFNWYSRTITDACSQMDTGSGKTQMYV